LTHHSYGLDQPQVALAECLNIEKLDLDVVISHSFQFYLTAKQMDDK